MRIEAVSNQVQTILRQVQEGAHFSATPQQTLTLDIFNKRLEALEGKLNQFIDVDGKTVLTRKQ